MNDQQIARADRLMTQATDAFEAGFASEAARKRALESVSRAYDEVKDAVMTEILARRTPENEEENRAVYWSVPMDLHQVRDKHFATLAAFDDFARVRDLVAMREAIRAEKIEAKPRDVQQERVERVRRSIVEEMEARKARFIEGLDLSRMFGMMVSVNAHYVTNDKGTTFLRHFFYLRGKLTALNTILAISDTLEREQA